MQSSSRDKQVMRQINTETLPSIFHVFVKYQLGADDEQ